MNINKTPEENPAIKYGVHTFSGIQEVNLSDDWTEIDGYALVIDGEIYLAYHDHDDGYRSYASLRKASKEESENIQIHNRFPQQDVLTETYHLDGEDPEDYITVDSHEFVMTSKDGNLILKVGTDYSEDYYPCGYMEYHPDNLPINIERHATN